MASFRIFWGGIITVVCIAIIIWLMSKFYEIASMDPWPQLIVIPACYVPPFLVGTIFGIFLLISGITKGIKSRNNKSSDWVLIEIRRNKKDDTSQVQE